MKKLALMLMMCMLSVTLLSGCQYAAKNFGGSYTVKLEQGQKLEMVTWKESELWILTRDMKPDESPEKYKFQEDSTFNIVEGTVNIIESK